ncbi:hypothetical protein JTE90_028020 [Oedothorax gibbosus]|uniref:Uncharacterized protein n=1 Tax=Oedothorax gibbosus TaxID=931172 RepID=A0AAV6VEV3_9ARAC|nr:hypothetical protein JTE90_028020 [Oedothorax gibbosus]
MASLMTAKKRKMKKDVQSPEIIFRKRRMLAGDDRPSFWPSASGEEGFDPYYPVSEEERHAMQYHDFHVLKQCKPT